MLITRGSDASALDGHSVGRSGHVDVGGVDVRQQACSIYSVDKLGLTSAVDHQVTQSSVGTVAVFTHHTCERHVACACMDGQVLRYCAGVHDGLVKRDGAVGGIQHSGGRVIEQH